jgi:hypothetical protein
MNLRTFTAGIALAGLGLYTGSLLAEQGANPPALATEPVETTASAISPIDLGDVQLLVVREREGIPYEPDTVALWYFITPPSDQYSPIDGVAHSEQDHSPNHQPITVEVQI